MPRVRPPRFPREARDLSRQGEALMRAIARLAPGHRDLVARLIAGLDPGSAAPGGGAAEPAPHLEPPAEPPGDSPAESED